MTYLGINITKSVRSLCTENYQTRQRGRTKATVDGETELAPVSEGDLVQRCPFSPDGSVGAAQPQPFWYEAAKRF